MVLLLLLTIRWDRRRTCRNLLDLLLITVGIVSHHRPLLLLLLLWWGCVIRRICGRVGVVYACQWLLRWLRCRLKCGKRPAREQRGGNLELELLRLLLGLGSVCLDLRNLLLEISLQQEGHKILGGHRGGSHNCIGVGWWLNDSWLLLLLLLRLHHHVRQRRGSDLKRLVGLLKVVGVAAVGVGIYRVGVDRGGGQSVAAINLLKNRTELLQALL